jgi:hypothetical protein
MVRNCQWVIKVEGERKKEKENERKKNGRPHISEFELDTPSIS